VRQNSSISSSEDARYERRFRRYTVAFVATAVAGFAVGAWLPVLAARADAERNFAGDSTVLVWGDSRTQHALDIERIGSAIGRPVWSLSRSGAGPYDLMVMEDLVPDGATVVISPSLAMLTRPAELDSNRVGLSWMALARLWRSGYPIAVLHDIWVNNRYSLRARRSQTHPTHAAADGILDEHLSAYRERLREVDPWIFELKWELLWTSIDRLLARGCDVYLVEAPVSGMFRAERRDSRFGDFSERLARAAAERRVPAFLNVELPRSPNPMWDHTHLNERGRDQFTGMLLDRWAASWRRSESS
jgi:hypothetical protein